MHIYYANTERHILPILKKITPAYRKHISSLAGGVTNQENASLVILEGGVHYLVLPSEPRNGLYSPEGLSTWRKTGNEPFGGQ